ATAEAAAYLAHPLSKVKTAVDFEEMRQYVLSYYEGVTVKHSFVYYSDHIDCVPILQQPAARRLGIKSVPEMAPPALHPAAAPSSPPALSPFETGSFDASGNRVGCDSGTVPIRRITLEHLSMYPTLRHAFRKAPGDPSPPPRIDANGYKHRTMSQWVNN